jgi:hypothetical protein
MSNPEPREPPGSGKTEPSSSGEDQPLLAHLIAVATLIAKSVRESPLLRAEVLSILRRVERTLSVTETSAPIGERDEPAIQVAAGIEGEPGSTPTGEVADRAFAKLVDQPPVAAPAILSERVSSEILKAMTTLDREQPSESISPLVVREDSRAVLETIVLSCRMKARASRWAVERLNLIAEGADYRSEIAPRDREIISEAGQLKDCYLWMVSASAPIPERPEQYEILAECYENAADVAELVIQIAFEEALEHLLDEVLHLAAEAQSALREAVSQVGLPTDDFTQVALFRELREITTDRRVYISQYMRRGDAADPSSFDSLAVRINNLGETMQKRKEAQQREKRTLNTIKYHVRQISTTPESVNDWRRIFETIQEIVPDPIKATDVRLRELLAPHIDKIPEDVDIPDQGQCVLEAIDKYLSAQPQPEEGAEPSKEILAVRERLRGKKVVVVGGDARAFAKEALQKAFDLSEVIWVTSREHQSPEAFRPAIQSPGVGAVLLAIRWSSHCFGVVKEYCQQAGVPFVRLPGGYNPNQVANQILKQISIPPKPPPAAGAHQDPPPQLGSAR